MMFAEFFQDTLLPALLSIATAAVTILTAKAITALQSWGQRQKSELVRGLVEEAAIAAERAVATVQQTFTEEVRAARADGKLTQEEAAIALRRAYGETRRQLGEDALTALARALGGGSAVEQMIVALIEAAIAKRKASAPATTSTVMVG